MEIVKSEAVKNQKPAPLNARWIRFFQEIEELARKLEAIEAEEVGARFVENCRAGDTNTASPNLYCVPLP